MAKEKEETGAAPAASASSEPVEYRPNRKVHLAEAGKVALSNWVGKVGNRRVRVYRGAQATAIPEPVQKAMIASGVQLGVITYEELGVRPPGALVIRKAPATPPATEL